MKAEFKADSSTTYYFDDAAMFNTSDGKAIKFISIQKKKFKKDNPKPVFQNLTFSYMQKKEIFEWLEGCLMESMKRES